MHTECTANDLNPSYVTLTKCINFLSLAAIKILICKMSMKAHQIFVKIYFIANIEKNKAHLFYINYANYCSLDIFLDHNYAIVIIIHTNYNSLQLEERRDI